MGANLHRAPTQSQIAVGGHSPLHRFLKNKNFPAPQVSFSCPFKGQEKLSVWGTVYRGGRKI